MKPDAALVRRADAAEAAACRDMYAAGEGTPLGLAAREVAGATLLVAKGIPMPLFNRVIGLGNAAPATERDLDAVAAEYRAAGIRQWWIHLSPGAQPAALAEMLAARGYAPAQRKAWAKFLRGTAPVPRLDTGLEIRALRAGEENALAEALGAAFEMPPPAAAWFARIAVLPAWRAVVAHDGARVVGGGLLFLHGEDAWLGAGGVRPEARGRHVHRALMLARIGLALEAGCRAIATETGEQMGDEPNPSLRNMLACGFEKVCSRLNYASPTA